MNLKKLICSNYVRFTGYNCLNGGVCTACVSFKKIPFMGLFKRGLGKAVIEAWIKE